jgi:hypothetical protein
MSILDNLKMGKQKKQKRKKVISYRKREAVSNFKNTTNIQPKKLSSD